MSPQPARVAVASARTDPRFVSGPSAHTTSNRSAAPGTTWSAVRLQGGKIESGGG
ncbi:hypothetical protein AB0N06_19070 [Streptomyces sp. NPDC051020]|uniref:hypothetical protein n=1 Tax=Streptomyces sp. NPDC051020 TaxID=3155409 RepID=UPI0034472589